MAQQKNTEIRIRHKKKNKQKKITIKTRTTDKTSYNKRLKKITQWTHIVRRGPRESNERRSIVSPNALHHSMLSQPMCPLGGLLR